MTEAGVETKQWCAVKNKNSKVIQTGTKNTPTVTTVTRTQALQEELKLCITTLESKTIILGLGFESSSWFWLPLRILYVLFVPA